MGKLIVAAAVGLLVFTVGLVSVVAVGAAAGSAGSGGAGRRPTARPATPAAVPVTGPPSPPPGWPSTRRRAATCPGMPWPVLAAIGTVETGSGQSTAPGVRSGANSAGAEGPMQFEPATFAAYATVGPGGARPASPYDPVDAVYTASALLCANGAGSAGEPPDRHRRLQPLRVLCGHRAHPGPRLPAEPGHPGHGGHRPVLRRPTARRPLPVGWHRRRVASTAPGLAQAAFAQAGVTLPRVAQDQFDAGPAVPAGSPVEPGDLVFFGERAISRRPRRHLCRGGRDDRRPPHRSGGAVR